MWKYVAFRAGQLLLAPLPRRLAYLAVDIIAWCSYLLARGSRRQVEANLRRVMGQGASRRQLDRAVRGVFKHIAYNYLELVRLPKLKRENMNKCIAGIHGKEHLQQAQDYGRHKGLGVIFTGAHLGPMDMSVQLFAHQGYKINVFMEPLKPKAVFDLIIKLRASQGVTFLPVGATGLKRAIRALNRGEIVGVVSDRAMQDSGTVMDFFGAPAVMPVGAAQLAVLTGAPILPTFAVRHGKDKVSLYYEPPIYPPERPTDDTVQALTKQVVAALETSIRSHPDQWLVFSPVWTDQPPSPSPENTPLRPSGTKPS